MIYKNLKKSILFILFFSASFNFTLAQEDQRDTTPPVISSVDIYMTSAVNVSVAWQTDEVSTSVIRYGFSPDNYDRFGYGENGTEHLVNAEDLTPGAEYFFEIKSVDESGNEAVSSGIYFSLEDFCSFAPRVLFLNSNPSSNSVSLDWETDIISNFTLKYGFSGDGIIGEVNGDELLKKHEVTIEGLEPSKDYFIELTSRNEVGLAGSVDNYYFTTLQNDSDPDNPEDTGGGTNSTNTSSGGGHSHAGEIKEVPCEDDVITPVKVIDTLLGNKAQNIKAVSLDGVIALSWNLPTNKDYSKVKIVRNNKNYPKDKNDGIVVYDGVGESISDNGLTNGRTYYYALYSYNNLGDFTEPILFSFAPYSETRHIHVLSVANFNLYDFSDVLKNNLKLGDKNDEVGHLQELLAIDPSVYPEGLITNYFGSLTDKAVKKIQEKFTVPVTGVVDEKTREVIISNSVKQKIIERNDVPEIASLSSNISVGMKGSSVSYLQKYLASKGFLKIEFVTGYFGEITRQAVVDFQKSNNISPASGFVGPKTRAKILENINITEYLK